MISLQPREKFAVVRVLGDHTDATTYYVLATVYDSITGATLGAFGLTNTGNRRFVYQYEVPADVSGLGRYIDITTQVFTDANYTMLASTYSDESDSYLIFDRITRLGGGGGDFVLDYKKLGAFFTAQLPVAIAAPLPDYTPILEALRALHTAVIEIKLPECEKTDFAPLTSILSQIDSKLGQGISAIIQKIEAIDIPEYKECPPTDLTPVLDKISAIEIPSNKEVLASIEAIPDHVQEIIRNTPVTVATVSVPPPPSALRRARPLTKK